MAIALAVACGGDGATCVVPPCVLGVAVTIALTPTAPGIQLSGVFVTVSGPVTDGGSCQPGTVTTCAVLGPPGTYQLDVGASGFQTVHRTVVVGGTPAENCGCGTTNTQHLDVALVAAT